MHKNLFSQKVANFLSEWLWNQSLEVFIWEVDIFLIDRGMRAMGNWQKKRPWAISHEHIV